MNRLLLSTAAAFVAAVVIPAGPVAAAQASSGAHGSPWWPPGHRAPITTPSQSRPAPASLAPQVTTAMGCTSGWTVVSSPDGYANNELNGIAAITPLDMWAVGDFNSSSPNGLTYDVRLTQAQHWDGSAWTMVATPNTASANTGTNILLSARAIASNDVWAVGFSTNQPQQLGGFASTLIEHWNGTSWSIVASPNGSLTNSALTFVQGTAGNDAWAVGQTWQSGSFHTLAEHWNGSSWSIVSTPNPATYNALVAVKALAANDVWSVGQQSSAGTTATTTTLIEHWNGSSWTVISSPNGATGTGTLFGVDGVTSDLYAVGATNNGTSDVTLVEHWNGTAWSLVAGVPTGGNTDLAGVAYVSPTNVVAVGSTGSVSTNTSFVVRWNGSTWVQETSANTGNSTSLFDVAAIGGDDWAVGSYLNAGNTAQTLTENTCTPPAVTSVTPSSGPPSGGTSVTINGSGLKVTTSVMFGAARATNVQIVSDNQVTATSPPGTPGTTVDVTIGYFGGSSATSPADLFSYFAAPGAPTNVKAVAGDTEVTVTFTPPAANGGSSVTGYQVVASPGGATTNVSAVAPAATITGLTNGTPYTFTVAATNVAGTGPASAPSSAVTPTAVSQATAVAVLPAMSNGAYGGYLTVTYLENYNPTPAHIRVQYFDQSGNSVGFGNSVAGLPFWGTWTLRQDNGDGLAAGAAGSAVVYSDQPLAVFVNEFAPTNGGDATSYSSVKVPGGAATMIYAPAIANNAYGGYTTGIGLINAGSVATDILVTYRDGSGNTIKTQTLMGVAPNAYQGLYSGDVALGLPNGFAGTATITSLGGQPLAAIVNETGPGGQFSSYDAVAAGAMTLDAPVALNNAFGGYFTGTGVQSTSASPGSVTIRYYDGGGNLVKTVAGQAIAANGYLGVYQGDATLGPPASSSGYTMVLTSTVPIAAIVNEVAPSATSAHQSTAYNTFAAGASSLNLPLVESGGADGWSTGEGIMNTGGSSTTVTVTYFDPASGLPVGTPQSQLLAPNAFWGVYQPSAGLPAGTRASAQVTTSGGQVAVICNESNATSFMSYIGE